MGRACGLKRVGCTSWIIVGERLGAGVPGRRRSSGLGITGMSSGDDILEFLA